MITTTRRAACTVDGCHRAHKARGLCNKHYKRARDRGLGNLPRKIAYCTVDGCTRRRHARGICAGHYDIWRRFGTTCRPVKQVPAAEIVYLRRLVGLPDDGPTEEQRARWAEIEARP